MAECSEIFVGMDVSKDRHAVAVADGGLRYWYGLGESGFADKTMTSRSSITEIRSIVEKASGTILLISVLNSSIVHSLTCCPTTSPWGVTLNKTCPPCWLSMAQTVIAAF